MLPLTIAINPTKETNIQMILLEEDIQQLRKIKGTGEQIFNFSTLRAAFKGVSRQKVKSKPVLNAACCLYITLQNYENKSSCIVINKLFISYKHREIHSPRPPLFFSYFCTGSCFQGSIILYTVYKINKLSNLPFIINKSFDSIIICSDTQTYNNYDCRQS